MDNPVSEPDTTKVLADSILFVILILRISFSFKEVSPNLQDDEEFTQRSRGGQSSRIRHPTDDIFADLEASISSIAK